MLTESQMTAKFLQTDGILQKFSVIEVPLFLIRLMNNTLNTFTLIYVIYYVNYLIQYPLSHRVSFIIIINAVSRRLHSKKKNNK